MLLGAEQGLGTGALLSVLLLNVVSPVAELLLACQSGDCRVHGVAGAVEVPGVKGLVVGQGSGNAPRAVRGQKPSTRYLTPWVPSPISTYPPRYLHTLCLSWVPRG